MPDEPIDGVKYSEFPSAIPDNADEVVGLHAGNNARFGVVNLILAARQGLANLFVPLTRTINNKALSSDITLDASDVGLGNVDNVQQYSVNNPPPYPVTSVNGSTGAVTVSVPSAYTSNPAMDGTASPGSSTAWAKGDHVHPSDTSKANQEQLAYVETGTTASRAYAAGEYFCWNGLLYRAKTAITSGASFTVGTNCEQVTEGGFNNLIRWISHSLITQSSYTINSLHLELLSGRLMVVSFSVTCVTASASSVNIGGVPSGYRPGSDLIVVVPSLSADALNFRVRQNGYVNAWGGTAGQTYIGTMTYVIP